MTKTPPFRLLSLLLVVLGVTLAAACREQPAAGDVLPDFRLAALEGGVLGPAALRGQVVLYDFWATWCGPCRIQADILHEMWPAVSQRGVKFVAVAVGEPEQVVREFLADHPSPYPVLIDPDDQVSQQLRILGLPTVVVVDRDGRVVYRTTGVTDRGELERALARAES